MPRTSTGPRKQQWALCGLLPEKKKLGGQRRALFRKAEKGDDEGRDTAFLLLSAVPTANWPLKGPFFLASRRCVCLDRDVELGTSPLPVIVTPNVSGTGRQQSQSSDHNQTLIHPAMRFCVVLKQV